MFEKSELGKLKHERIYKLYKTALDPHIKMRVWVHLLKSAGFISIWNSLSVREMNEYKSMHKEFGIRL